MKTSAHKPRGFTLIELVIAIALGVVVIGTATAVLATVLADNRRARAHSTLQRDAEFVSQLLNQEIRQAGLGVPPTQGQHIQQDCISGTCSKLYGDCCVGGTGGVRFTKRRLLVATDTAIGILGDLPRPDGNYSTFGPLHNRRSGTGNAAINKDGIAWHTENNGPCVRVTAGCTQTVTSLFFAGAGECTTGNELTCPWGARRLAPGEPLQIVDGGGSWSHAQASNPFTLATAVPAASGGAEGLRLAFSFDASTPPVWRNDAIAAAPTGVLGQGWVTTLDRVFYRLNGTNIERRQCWGDPDPSDANWPSGLGLPTDPAAMTPSIQAPAQLSSAGTVCTAAEVVAKNVITLDFDYLDDAGNPIAVASDADANAVRQVAWNIVLEFANLPGVSGPPVRYTIQGAARMENVDLQE